MSDGKPTRFVTKSHPDTHKVVDNCLYTQGPTPGRDSECMICLEVMTEEDKTVTHGLPGIGECNNAFHLSCFDLVVSSAKLADEFDPQGANSSCNQFAKCPACRGKLFPYEKQGCALPPNFAAERERDARGIGDPTTTDDTITFDHLIFEPRSPDLDLDLNDSLDAFIRLSQESQEFLELYLYCIEYVFPYYERWLLM